MIRFRTPPAPDDPARTVVVAGIDLEDALAQFGNVQDCLGCSAVIAAPSETSDATIASVRSTLLPLSTSLPTVRPESSTGGFLRRGGHWADVNIDAQAQRLTSVRMPSTLVSAQRLLVVNDLRKDAEPRPVIAIGLWAHFAHPVVRFGARFGGTTDGLVTEIALSMHPDRYVVLERDRDCGLTFVLTSPDIVATELITLGLRQQRARSRGAGPWEDPLVQAATDLNLGVRTPDAIDIEAIISPTLSTEQRSIAEAVLLQMAEMIGVPAYL